MKNFVNTGSRLSVLLTADVNSGDAIKVGSIIGVATTSGKTGDTVALVMQGVVTLPKVTANTVAIGDKLYWDDTAKKITTTDNSGANILAGYAFSAESNTSTKVNVRLIF